MIGSSTCIVKEHGKYCAHVMGSIFHSEVVARGNPFRIFSEAIATWGKPEVLDLTAIEVDEIASATNCCDENKGQPGYHRLAGDGVYLVDMDKELVLWWDHRDNKWTNVGNG